MNALRRIHAALVPGGLLIDTQPVSAQPPIQAGTRHLGTLDMREWTRTIATVDAELRRAVDDGLFAIDAERRFVVTDGHESGAGLVAEVRTWAGTHIDDALAGRVAREHGPVQLHQEVRLRVLRAC